MYQTYKFFPCEYNFTVSVFFFLQAQTTGVTVCWRWQHNLKIEWCTMQLLMLMISVTSCKSLVYRLVVMILWLQSKVMMVPNSAWRTNLGECRPELWFVNESAAGWVQDILENGVHTGVGSILENGVHSGVGSILENGVHTGVCGVLENGVHTRVGSILENGVHTGVGSILGSSMHGCDVVGELNYMRIPKCQTLIWWNFAPKCLWH